MARDSVADRASCWHAYITSMFIVFDRFIFSTLLRHMLQGVGANGECRLFPLLESIAVEHELGAKSARHGSAFLGPL